MSELGYMARATILLVAVVLGAAAFARPAAAAPVAWCGNDQLSADRPDARAGRKIHVVYAIPADGADRFRDAASWIATDLGVVTAWWLREDPSRAPRWDVFDFPGCGTELGRLDLTFVRLPRPSAAYHASAQRLELLGQDLTAASLAARNKKYLVYYDGPVAEEDICGSAFGRTGPELGGSFAVAGIWFQNHPAEPGCGILGREAYAAKTSAHEILHMLGAVPSGAPNACPVDLAHVCGNTLDVMFSGGSSGRLPDYSLDAGHDDYYAHGGSWLDVQDSLWLARIGVPDRRLTVTISGATGGSSVTSALPGIDCPSASCDVPWPDGDVVDLTAGEGSGDRFVRWGGDCSGADGACRLTMDRDRTVTALFGPSGYRFTVVVRGRGTVTSAALRPCGSRCSQLVPADARVDMRARPAKGWRFVRWSGKCAGARPVCGLRATAPASIVAVFRRR